VKFVCECDGVAVQPYAYLNFMHGVLRMAQKYNHCIVVTVLLAYYVS